MPMCPSGPREQFAKLYNRVFESRHWLLEKMMIEEYKKFYNSKELDEVLKLGAELSYTEQPYDDDSYEGLSPKQDHTLITDKLQKLLNQTFFLQLYCKCNILILL